MDPVSESYLTRLRIERVVPVIRSGALEVRNAYPLLFIDRQLEPRLTFAKMKRLHHLALPAVVPAKPIEVEQRARRHRRCGAPADHTVTQPVTRPY